MVYQQRRFSSVYLRVRVNVFELQFQMKDWTLSQPLFASLLR